MDRIERLLEKLAAYEHSEAVYNPYKDKNAINNLREYLGLFLTDVQQVNLLVGEAPGYLGCRITGIPFTSSKQLTNTTHPLLSKIKEKLKFSSIQSENTANFMWDVLADKKTSLYFGILSHFTHIKRITQNQIVLRILLKLKMVGSF